MHQPEPPPRHVLALLGVGYRVVIGAVLGFVCAVVIIVADHGASAFATHDGLSTFGGACRIGATLGAIYLPVASAWFLPQKDQPKMVAVAFIAAIIFGVVGDAALGPWAPVSVAASFGFWLVVLAMYQRDQRNRNWRGRGSYLQ